MSTATMELAESESIASATRLRPKSNEAMMRLFEMSGRVIEWMQTRKDRVAEAYITSARDGWNLYVLSKAIEHDFQLSRELSQFAMSLFDDLEEYIEPRLVSLGSSEDVKAHIALNRAVRLSPG